MGLPTAFEDYAAVRFVLVFLMYFVAVRQWLGLEVGAKLVANLPKQGQWRIFRLPQRVANSLRLQLFSHFHKVNIR